MPQFSARRRAVNLHTIGHLYAVPIISLTDGRFRHSAYFHPRESFLLNGTASSIIDSVTAASRGYKVGNKTNITLVDPKSGHRHDLEITIGRIVDNYPGPNGYPPKSVAPPRPFIWVSAEEIITAFSFSNPDPLPSVYEMTLNALQTSLCY